MNQTEKRLRGIGVKTYYISTITEKGERKYLGYFKASSPLEAMSLAKLDWKLTPHEKKHMKFD